MKNDIGKKLDIISAVIFLVGFIGGIFGFIEARMLGVLIWIGAAGFGLILFGMGEMLNLMQQIDSRLSNIEYIYNEQQREKINNIK